jgi:hypothetical protein
MITNPVLSKLICYPEFSRLRLKMSLGPPWPNRNSAPESGMWCEQYLSVCLATVTSGIGTASVYYIMTYFQEESRGDHMNAKIFKKQKIKLQVLLSASQHCDPDLRGPWKVVETIENFLG